MGPIKVVIEITAEGESKTVYCGERVIARKTSTMVSSGESRSNEKGDWYEALCQGDEGQLLDLAESLEDIELGTFGVASALHEFEESYC